MTEIYDIEKIFSYHAPNEEKTDQYKKLRRKANEFAIMINSFCPDGREKREAFKKLEEVIMWSNASIARH